MRIIKLFLCATLSAAVACGGAGYEKAGAASSPPAGGRGPQGHATSVHREMAGVVQAAPYSDSDGIPDAEDRVQEERVASNADMAPPMPAPAAPSGGAPAAPPAKKPDVGSGSTGGPGQSQPAPSAKDQQYLIYTANLTMAVYQVEGALAQVEQVARDVNGYLANRTDRQITIRVPRARFDEAIKKVETTGDVIHRDIQAQDVSDEFLDTEVRLKNARAMRDRLEQLLQRAPVKEALEIEREMGRITQEIERMEGRLKVLKDKIAYSTITVTFDARAASLHTMPIRLPFGWLQTLGLPALLRLNESK